MFGPRDVAASLTGLPKASKPTHRGRKPSGKPGANHMAQMQQAHGAGDFAAAKTHALNFANAMHQHMKNGMVMGGLPGISDVIPQTTNPDAVLDGADPGTPDAPSASSARTPTGASSRAQLAKVLAARAGRRTL